MFYVLYQFVTYLLTLPRMNNKQARLYTILTHMTKILIEF
jgi:hypothetical protein